MRKIRGSVFVSLDGVMQAPGGPTEDPTGGFAHGGWLPQFFDEDVGQAIDDFFGKDYDLLLGRRTYDIFAAYWHYSVARRRDRRNLRATARTTARPRPSPGRGVHRADKYVLTRGTPDLGWSNSHRVGGIDELGDQARRRPRLLIQGSSTIYPALSGGIARPADVDGFSSFLAAAKGFSAWARR